MSNGTFKKIGKSAEAIYGSRAILLCGFAPLEQKKMIELLDNIQIKDIRLIFATAEHLNTKLGDLLALPDQTGRDINSNIERAVVFSGITELELQQIMSYYNNTGLPRPLWAALTPFSENWPLSSLLEELKKEHKAMTKENNKSNP